MAALTRSRQAQGRARRCARACRARPDPLAACTSQELGDLWITSPLGVSDKLVIDEEESVTDGPGVDEAHGLLAGGFAEEALADPEHDREDDQPYLVDEVVLDQRAPEPIA